jgi:hypothetical protein
LKAAAKPMAPIGCLLFDASVQAELLDEVDKYETKTFHKFAPV